MFQLDMRSSRSIYEQVIDNFKELITRGVLEPDSKLPSVRELSRSLTVNPNTVQKAYRELERQGFIYTVQGRGAFVSPRENVQVDTEEVKRIKDSITQEVRELSYIGLSHEEIAALLTEIADEIH